ncbi:MAG: hypothetical protein U0798_21345 [Gemmataceae bacterium]
MNQSCEIEFAAVFIDLFDPRAIMETRNQACHFIIDFHDRATGDDCKRVAVGRAVKHVMSLIQGTTTVFDDVVQNETVGFEYFAEKNAVFRFGQFRINVFCVRLNQSLFEHGDNGDDNEIADDHQHEKAENENHVTWFFQARNSNADAAYPSESMGRRRISTIRCRCYIE